MDQLSMEDPHRIGPYRLLARLGEGGMGRVYLARSDRGRTVAVKTIRRELAQEPDFRRRFAQEITAARRVGGQWTAPVLDADTEAPTPWVATGYIAGPSLHQVVSHDFGPLPERSVLLLAGGLAQALRAIHGAGLVHRDLKPSNVLMTIDGPRVIDFGIARVLETAPGDGLTRTGVTVGSPGFMSPEQVRGQRLTPASDVFCLGSLLAFAATGRTPFGALDSGVHILMFRIAEELPDLTGLSGDLHGLISSCLSKDPAQRVPVETLLRCPAPDGQGEPWLPGALVARLGREAVSLLDSENPLSRTDNRAVSLPPGTQGTSAPPAGTTGPQSPPQSPPPTSPYAQPTAPYPPPGVQPQRPGAMGYQGQAPGATTPAGPLGPGAGGFGPSPYLQAHPQPQPPGGGAGRRGRLVALALVVVAAALGGVLAAQLLTGGDGDDGGGGGDRTPIDAGYLGAWQGEYGERGDDGWRALRFDIRQGAEGEIIGTASTASQDVLCTFDMRLSAFGDRLEFTREARSAVPDSASQDTCLGNDDVQTLQLRGGGELVWRYSGQRAALTAAPGPRDAVPDGLVGTWIDEWENDEGTAMRDEVTIEQGAVGDTVLIYALTEGDSTCTWRNHLVQVDGDRMLMGPDVLVEEESAADCRSYGAFWAWVGEAQGEEALLFLWANDPDSDPYAIFPE